MADEIFVNDVRTNEDASLNIVPRISSYEELQQYFGVEVERQFGWDVTPQGQACWKIVGFEVRTGVAAYIPQIKKEDGSPYPEILTIRWWPDVDKYDQTVKPHYRLAENPKWDGGFTDANGTIGMAYGGGSIGGPDGGPDVIWVSASPPGQQPQYSDAVSGLGWIGGTDHLNPNPIFQYTVKGSTPTPTGQIYLVNIQNGIITGYIPWIPGSPSQSGQYIGLWQDGQVVYNLPWQAGQPE